jgi:ABC-type multidrug transport system ATPase subunit
VQILLANTGKKFVREWIFRGIDLDIKSGERVVVLGPNGSGKSTFLQLMSGYVLPSVGTIRWLSNGVLVPDDEVFRHVSLAAPYLEVPEELSLNELVQFHFRFKPLLAGLTTADVILRSGLEKHADKPVRTFSSGMKQRVRLMLAFCSDTSLLLLDEPCSNFDRQAVDWYQAIAAQFLGNRTVVVCSNHQDQEYTFCHRQLNVGEWKV